MDICTKIAFNFETFLYFVGVLITVIPFRDLTSAGSKQCTNEPFPMPSIQPNWPIVCSGSVIGITTMSSILQNLWPHFVFHPRGNSLFILTERDDLLFSKSNVKNPFVFLPLKVPITFLYRISTYQKFCTLFLIWDYSRVGYLTPGSLIVALKDVYDILGLFTDHHKDAMRLFGRMKKDRHCR